MTTPEFTSKQGELILKIGDTLASAAESIASLRDSATELSSTNPNDERFIQVELRTQDALTGISQTLSYLTELIKGEKNQPLPSPEEMEFIDKIAIEMAKLTPIIGSISKVIVSNTSPDYPPSEWVINFTVSITSMFRSMLAPISMLRETQESMKPQESVKPVKPVNKNLN